MTNALTQCKIHRLAITSFCTAHEVAMCMNCLLGGHSGCIKNVIAIQTAIESATEKRISIQFECEDLACEVDEKCAAKERRLRQYKVLSEHLRQGIRQIRLKMLERINSVSRNALDLINSVMVEQTGAIELEISKLLEFKGTLTPTIAKLNDDVTQESDLTTGLKAIRDSMVKIRKELYQEPWSAGEVDVHFLVSNYVSELLDTFDSLGEVLVEGRSDQSVHAQRNESNPDNQQMSGYVPFRKSIVGDTLQDDTDNGQPTNAFLSDAMPKPCGIGNLYTSIPDMTWDQPEKCPSPPSLPKTEETTTKKTKPAIQPRILIRPPTPDADEKTDFQEPIEIRVRPAQIDSNPSVNGAIPFRDKKIDRQGKSEMMLNPKKKVESKRLEMFIPKHEERAQTKESSIRPGHASLQRPFQRETSKRANSDTNLVRDLRKKIEVRALRANSFDPNYANQQSGPCRLTGVAALSKGRLIICDYSHDHLQLIGADGALVDRYLIKGPFGVCAMSDETFAVTSVERSSIGIFRIDENRIFCEREVIIQGNVVGYGISFMNGMFSLACHRQVQLLSEDLSTIVTTIDALSQEVKQTSGLLRRRKQQCLFAEAAYTVIDYNGRTPLVYLSDKIKDMVVCVDVKTAMKWKTQVIDPSGLLLLQSRIYVAGKRKIVVLDASTGIHITDIKDGMPKHPITLTFSPQKQALVVTYSLRKKHAKNESLLKMFQLPK